MQSLEQKRPRKTPTLHRSLGIWFALVLLLWPGALSAQQVDDAPPAPLTETDVIRLARTRSPGAAVAHATEDLAQARTDAAALLPDPSVTWERETVQTGPMTGRGSQDILRALIPIDIARPLASRSLVASQSAWMRAEASLSRNDAILEAVLAYYDVALAEQRVEVLSESVANLEEAARVLARRESAGAVSGYESTRLSIASELSHSRLAEARGTLESAKARLAALLGLRPASVRVPPELALMSPRDQAALVQAGSEHRAAVQQAHKSQQLADQARDRAGWAWLPRVEVGGGMKRADNAGMANGYGYFVGASISIPLFDRGQGQRGRAEAQRALSKARSRALQRTIHADVQSALATFRAARQELRRFEAHTSDQVEVLLEAAQSGYREGERTIVELLDAQRAQTDVAQRRLSLLGTAKRAEARLRAAAGDLQ